MAIVATLMVPFNAVIMASTSRPANVSFRLSERESGIDSDSDSHATQKQGVGI